MTGSRLFALARLHGCLYYLMMRHLYDFYIVFIIKDAFDRINQDYNKDIVMEDVSGSIDQDNSRDTTMENVLDSIDQDDDESDTIMEDGDTTMGDGGTTGEVSTIDPMDIS